MPDRDRHDILKEPIGKQDQYIAAYGGITCFRFLPGGQVEAWPLKISQRTLYDLEDHLQLFFTGYTRSASAILREQDVKSKKHDQSMIANLHFIKQTGKEICEALERGDLERFGELMNAHWEYKKARSSAMSNDRINHFYDVAMAHGAARRQTDRGRGWWLSDVPLPGAGSGCREAMLPGWGLEEVRFRFDFEGTKVIIQ